MKKRIEWIDILRGIAMFLVILGHAFIDKKSIYRKYIYSFHMPLFFFVSGLTYRDKNEGFLEFIKGKFKKLVIPYLILNAVVFIIKLILHLVLHMYNSLSIELSLKALLTAYGNDLPCIQSWFLLCLLLVELIFYILKRISKNDTILSILVLCITSLGFYISKHPCSLLNTFHINAALVVIMFYYLGYLYGKVKPVQINKHVKALIAVCSLVGSILLQHYNSGISMNANRYGNIAHFITSSVLSILVYVYIAKCLEGKDKVFQYIGVHSMFFLGYHAFFLTIIKDFCPILLSNLLLTILVSICATAIIYPLCIVVYKKCPILVGKLK